MSEFLKEDFESKNGIKSQKDIILEKIHRIKSYNNDLIAEYFPFKKYNKKNNKVITPFCSQSKHIMYDSSQNSTYKKVFIKPLVKNNKLYLAKHKYHTNNFNLSSNLNFSKIEKLNKNNNIMDINNNAIKSNIRTFENKTIINNENSLNETTSDYDIDKISNFQNNNTISNNIDNNIIDNFFSAKDEKKNNIINLKNQNIHDQKKSSEFSRICLKNNNNININILEKMNTTKAKDSININSINLISNNDIRNINDNPLFLDKIFSLSKTINETDIINSITPDIIKTNSKIGNQRIMKNLKNRLFLDSKNIETNKANEDLPTSNYYISITEVNPNSKLDEIEEKNILNKKQKGEKFQRLNFLESKKIIFAAIAKEKQKIINESIKNYRKYLFLIHKQQQEYEEYDEYLKKELNNNKNIKKKLQIFKDKLNLGPIKTSKLSLLKNKNLVFEKKGCSINGNKNFSSKNFDLKYRKKNILSNKNGYKEKRLLTINNDYEPLLTEGNNSNIKYIINTNIDKGIIKPMNKKILKIRIDDINKFKKIVIKNKNINRKNNSLKNNINSKSTNKNNKKKNISNFNIESFASDSLQKSPIKKINSQTIKYPKNYKNSYLDNFMNVNKNKMNIKNANKSLILKKLMNNYNSKKQKIITKKNGQFLNNHIKNFINNPIKYKSFKKLEKPSDYREKIEMHKMITEEKRKVLNKFNKNIYKLKENINNFYDKQTKNRDIKNVKQNRVAKEYKSDSFKIKNE